MQFNPEYTTKQSIAWWGGLVILTLLAWQLEASGFANSSRWATSGILLISFAKIRVVIRQFMDVRHAAIGLKIVFDIWCAVVLAALLYIFNV